LDDRVPKTLNRAGFRRLLGEDGKLIKGDADHLREYGERMKPADAELARVDFIVLREVFEREVCRGFSPKAAARLLQRRGHLVPNLLTACWTASASPAWARTRCLAITCYRASSPTSCDAWPGWAAPQRAVCCPASLRVVTAKPKSDDGCASDLLGTAAQPPVRPGSGRVRFIDTTPTAAVAVRLKLIDSPSAFGRLQ